MAKPSISYLNANTLELHYLFNDETHTMDAIIQNKCEYELLGIIKEIAATFDAQIVIETEPLAEGGIKRWFKIISKAENKSAIITTAIITAIATGIIVTPITTTLSKLTEKLIENVFEDKELKKLEKEKIKSEIENFKTDTELKRQKLIENRTIIKRRSNFYETLEKYPKINQISVIIEDESKTHIGDEKFVERKIFKEFILVTDALTPIEVDDAIIEIISPVLKKGNYKWRGIYEGETVSFDMKSNEFKTLVQTGKIEFKNGSSIKCLLEIERQTNNEGIEEIVGYNITRVNEYFENDKPIETPEGKNHRQKQDADKNQTKIPFDKKE
jgi:hypothetical protein